MAEVPNKNDDRHKEEVASGRDESEGTLEISDDLDENYLYKIAKEIEAELYFDLGMTLGFKYAEVQAVKTSNPHDSRQWVFLILNKWRQGQRRDADNIRILTDALEEIKKVDLADKVRAEKQQSLGPLHIHLSYNDKERLEAGVRETQKQDTGIDASFLEQLIFRALKSVPTLYQSLTTILSVMYGMHLCSTYMQSIVLQLKVVDRRKAARLLTDFKSGSLTLLLVKEIIPEEVRLEYSGSYIDVTLTIEEKLVQECLRGDEAVQDQDGSFYQEDGASSLTFDEDLTRMSTDLEKLDVSKVKTEKLGGKSPITEDDQTGDDALEGVTGHPDVKTAKDDSISLGEDSNIEGLLRKTLRTESSVKVEDN
ncbi:unnamed protein product, partial [Owenia fusiformis]